MCMHCTVTLEILLTSANSRVPTYLPIVPALWGDHKHCQFISASWCNALHRKFRSLLLTLSACVRVVVVVLCVCVCVCVCVSS